ncbi:hypothetical protein C5167_016486 [Papaver somniferum]|nr:hypothetical protein C5167_016486 [Papaver somniferum]
METKVLFVTSPDDYSFRLSIESLLCFRGELYAFCEADFARNWVIKIDVQKLWQHVVDNKQTQYIIDHIAHADFTWIGGGEEFSRFMEHWVESGDEIFKVHLNCSPRGFKKVASTHIFKLDFSSMTWVLLKTLDDHVLFLCINTDTLESRKCYSTSTACCSAADMGLERASNSMVSSHLDNDAYNSKKQARCWKKEKNNRSSSKPGYNCSQYRRGDMSRLSNSGGELEALNSWIFLIVMTFQRR